MDATRQPNATRKTRPAKRELVFSLVVGGCLTLTSTGCATRSMSLASMNPFASKSTATVSEPNKGPSFIASAGDSVGKAAGGVGTATKNAWGKTTGTVAGWFNRGSSDVNSDPLSLENEPGQLEPDVLVANGQLWESTGNLTKAMESYSKALEDAPNHASALTSVARLHFREGNHSKAAEFFQKAIAQNPNDAALYNDLGLTLGKLGQHPMAVQTLARALELAPGTSRYANNLASVHFESGQSEQAFKVLAANNKPAVAHFNMAFLHYKKGQNADAQIHLQQAVTHEAAAAGDPATKRAIDRSREMLAQLNPGLGTSPAANIASAATPGKNIGAAAGPVATVASAPAHLANQTPPSYAAPPSYAIPGATQPSGQQPVVPGSNSAVSYQDSSAAAPAESPKADAPKAEGTAPATESKESAPPINFSLPE
ncbi:O-linked GlcNAc transferase [Rhodopirellula baltica SH28]|uniref:O-linked GlcNAc transferase n=1 Tax=Rhodopirellula baltica SH28 TaxID=993517 RepID=K5DBW1_RHOBT|nr:tetratricopeptide repeat protein [Rhodopirellula baltica]EKJ99952.1 O-linked GlcNAc transferase [Rhodopirellula baltica SH28]